MKLSIFGYMFIDVVICLLNCHKIVMNCYRLLQIPRTIHQAAAGPGPVARAGGGRQARRRRGRRAQKGINKDIWNSFD